jgi:hypothetical protein
MTLKSLHTQYVKPIRKMAVMLTLLLAVVSLLSLTRGPRRPQDSIAALPRLIIRFRRCRARRAQGAAITLSELRSSSRSRS